MSNILYRQYHANLYQHLSITCFKKKPTRHTDICYTRKDSDNASTLKVQAGKHYDHNIYAVSVYTGVMMS